MENRTVHDCCEKHGEWSAKESWLDVNIRESELPLYPEVNWCPICILAARPGLEAIPHG